MADAIPVHSTPKEAPASKKQPVHKKAVEHVEVAQEKHPVDGVKLPGHDAYRIDF